MIDINKQYRTRSGREVRIYATDGGLENCMVHGAMKNKMGYWEMTSWYTKHGGFYDNPDQHPHDLIEVRPRHKRTVWINTYGATVSGGLYSTRENADEAAVSRRTGCIKVELDFEEGEGL
jgi:hypothetical protein